LAKGETGKSEYRSRYEVHRDAAPPKLCKPPTDNVSSDLPLNATTTHRSYTAVYLTAS